MELDNHLHQGHRSRLREKLKGDPKSLADHELLEIVLYGVIPFKDTNALAHQLLKTFGGFEGVLNAEREALMSIPNMTANASIELKAFRELSERAQRVQEIPLIRTPRDAVEFLRQYYTNRNLEELLILGVDARGKVTYRESVWSQENDSVTFDMRDVLAKIISAKPKGVLLCHNHPTAKAFPSPKDIATTEELNRYLDGLGIKFLDHLIIGENGEIYSLTAHTIIAEDPQE